MRRGVWYGVTVVAAFLIALEVVCTALAFASMRYRQRLPGATVARRLFLTRPLAMRLMRRDARVAAYTGGKQRFLGELNYDAASIEFAAPDALLGVRNGRNITILDDQSVYVTNDQGFASIGERDFHYDQVPRSNCRRIIVVGGSTVFGWRAGTPDWNLPARLRRALERHRAGCYELINAGVPGYTSAQEFLFVASELIHYQPHLFIVYDGWNDQAQSSRAEPVEVNSLKGAHHRIIENRVRASYSVAGSTWLTVLNLGEHLRGTSTYWAVTRLTRRFSGNAHPRAVFGYDATVVARYRSNLLAMIDVSAARGIPIALFLQPLKWVDGRELESIRSADREYAEARRAFYTDARPMFANLAKQYRRAGTVCIDDMSESLKDVAGTSYVDSGHVTGPGNDIVAAEIVTRLARCGLLPD